MNKLVSRLLSLAAAVLVLAGTLAALPVFARYAIDNYNVSFQRVPGYGMY